MEWLRQIEVEQKTCGPLGAEAPEGAAVEALPELQAPPTGANQILPVPSHQGSERKLIQRPSNHTNDGQDIEVESGPEYTTAAGKDFADKEGALSASFMVEEKVYLRWDNINYYVPVKKEEKKTFEKREALYKAFTGEEEDGGGPGFEDTMYQSKNVVREKEGGRIAK